MSEAPRGEYPTEPEKQRLAAELQRIQSLRFFRHNGALLYDALQSQALSAQEAKEKGLKFVDIYTQETSATFPQDRVISVLLTPDGDWIRPGEPKPHFFIYFSTLESTNILNDSYTGLLNWVEKVDADGNSQMYTLTEEGVQHTITDTDEAIALLREGNELVHLSPLETRELLDDVRSNRLAPQDHAAIKQ